MKQIGAHKGQVIENIIDQNDLKVSHVPIPRPTQDTLQILSSFYGSTNLPVTATGGKVKEVVAAQRREYQGYKSGSEGSNVPFSTSMRNRLERSYDKFDKVNGYGASVSSQNHGWKVPTYDLN